MVQQLQQLGRVKGTTELEWGGLLGLSQDTGLGERPGSLLCNDVPQSTMLYSCVQLHCAGKPHFLGLVLFSSGREKCGLLTQCHEDAFSNVCVCFTATSICPGQGSLLC